MTDQSEATIDVSVSAKFWGEMDVLVYTAEDDKWEETFAGGVISGDGVGPDAVRDWVRAWSRPLKQNKSRVVVRLTPGAARFLLWDFDTARFDIWEDEVDQGWREKHGFIRTGRRVRAELRAWLDQMTIGGR